MPYSVEPEASRPFAQLFGSLDKLFRLRDRDDVVGCSVDQDLFRSIRKELDRAPGVESVRMLIGCSTHEPCNDAVSQPLFPGSPKIAHTCKRDRAPETILLSGV